MGTQAIYEVRQALKRGMHRPLPEPAIWLRAVVQGHFNYLGVPGNQQAMGAFRTEAIKGWLRALHRRSHKGANLTWQRLQK